MTPYDEATFAVATAQSTRSISITRFFLFMATRAVPCHLVVIEKAARAVGDPYDNRPRNDNGTTGEYAIPAYYSLIFTPLMFLICGVLLFWEFSLNGWEAEPLVENPSYGPSVETLIDAGAKRTDLIVDDGDWWRLISRKRLVG